MGRGRSEKQKQKLLYMAQLLYERTDEDHPVTTQEVIDYLEADGIRSERKTVYTDMEELEDFGLDIIRVKERPGGYYLASRKFELAELKLLVDAVQASKFITTKKSRELIAKLETLCGREQAMIYNAIAENVKIRFQYFEWTVNKEMKLRRDGSYYEVSPWLLSWDDENYYLIAYDDRSRDIRHYRVDKMLKIELTAESREGKEQFGNFDVAAYSRKTFGMFAGEDETVTLICEDALTGVMIDRFGKEVAMRRYDETRIRVRVSVAVSRQFFGWLAGLGAAVRIESPESVVREYREYLETILKTYGEQEL